MSARDRQGEIRGASCPSERSAHGATSIAAYGNVRQQDKHRAVFIGATDLLILSTALAQFIVDAGRHAREELNPTEVIRAREMMDWVDDELYALTHKK